jgi:WhiB family redox-sensing transcriptional regulator
LDPELFFPEGTEGPAIEAVARAKRVCGACEVRARCLDWALSHEAHFGVWGGRTEEERRGSLHTPSQPRRGPGQSRAVIK